MVRPKFGDTAEEPTHEASPSEGILAQPIEAKDKVQLLIERLAKAVAEGSLLPGQQLPSEREFSQELSVSRSIVREALSALAATGLVTRREGHGTFVSRAPDISLLKRRALALLTSSYDPYNACLAREALEPALAPMIVSNATDEDCGKLALAMNSLGRACANRDWAGHFESDQGFHAALVAATHNSAVMQAMESLLEEMQAPSWTDLKRAYFEGSPARMDASARRHERILAAVLSQDVLALEQSLRDHFTEVRSVLELAGPKLRTAGSKTSEPTQGG